MYASRWTLLTIAVVAACLVTGAVIAGGVITGQSEGGTGLEFREATDETGFTYNATAPAGVIADSGVYAADYDGDGWTDLLAVGGKTPTLFDNDGGEFTPTGQLEGVETPIRGAIFLDHDADGDRDLVLLPGTGTPILFANEDGTLERRPGVLNVSLERPIGATTGDYNRDGCPDLFVIQNGNWLYERPESHDTTDVHPDDDNGNPNLLFEGTCGGFENVTRSAGIRGNTWSLAASMVDLDGDGRPDIHVANDFNNDVIYWNDGDGNFTREILSEETNRNGMASEIADFSGNGRLDVFITNIDLPENVSGETAFVAGDRAEGNNLLVNQGDRRLSPAGERCGVREGGWGWATVGADLDNDGDTDLFHTTLEFTARLGTELLEARQRDQVYSYPAVFERRSGPGCSFVRGNASAVGFEATDGHGTAGVDFDRDGDIDIAVATSPKQVGDVPFRLYENVGARGNAVQIRVVGPPEMADSARVFLETGGDTQMGVSHSRSDYFSQDERVLHFGLGNRSTADLRIVWGDGTTRAVEDVEAGTRLIVSPDGVERTVALDGGSAWSIAGTTALLFPLTVVLVIGIAVVGYRRGGG